MGRTTLQTIQSANSAFARGQPLTVVATGGTSGIGEYTIHTIAQHYSRSQQPLRVYIVGRNASSAARIISDCYNIYPNGNYYFIRATDLSLLRDADVACHEVERQVREHAAQHGFLPSINILLMSHCDFPFGGRRETEEGLEKTMSMLYYSRMRIAMNLLTLLKESNQGAHVISVYAAGLENPKSWNPQDLLIRQDKQYSIDRCRTHSTMMKTMFMERLAQENAGKVAFVHVFPGLVLTQGFKDKSHPLWFKAAWAILGPVAKLLIAISPAEIGERILFLASSAFPPKDSKEATANQNSMGLEAAISTDGVLGGGAYSCGRLSQTNNLGKTYASSRQQKLESMIVNHTLQVFRDIETVGVYKS